MRITALVAASVAALALAACTPAADKTDEAPAAAEATVVEAPAADAAMAPAADATAPAADASMAPAAEAPAAH